MLFTDADIIFPIRINVSKNIAESLKGMLEYDPLLLNTIEIP